MPLNLDGLTEQLIDHINTWWPASGTIAHAGGTISPPTFAEPNSGYKPGRDPFIEVELMWSGSSLAGDSSTGARHHRGIVQTNVFVPIGWGPRTPARIRDRVEAMWKAADIENLSLYATTPLIPLPGSVVPPGFFGQHADTTFHWIADSA